MADNITERVRALPKVIPERLREAREARGMTVEVFADAIGVSRQAVAQFELGQTSPSAPVLSAIIGITRQPPAFFTSQRKRAGGDFQSPFWRSLRRMEQPSRLRIGRRLEWAADIVDMIEQFIELPPVRVPSIDWSLDRDDEEIEDIASMVREHWSLGEGPLPQIIPILEYNGIVVISEHVECENMDAVSRWQLGRPYILCSSEVESGPRMAYNLAHELGHLVLHADVELDSRNLAKVERQANRFAGAFLLPQTTFPKEVLSTSLSYFETLKRRWGVSIAAMVYRCKDLSILSETQVRYLWRQMNTQKIRRKEPLDDAFDQGFPSLIKSSLQMITDRGVQAKRDIEEKLHLNPSDFESLSGVKPGWLAPEKVVPIFRRAALKSMNDA